MYYSKVEYSIIVAFCKRFGIGYKNKLPWHFKDDMKHFYKLTTSTPFHYDNTKFYKNDKELSNVIMGHNTWKSLQYKPLKNRMNIILTSNIELCREKTMIMMKKNNYCNENQIYYNDNIKNILYFNCPYKIEEYILNRQNPHAWIIGGSTIYDFYLKNMNVENIYSTLIHKDYKCDTFFNMSYINNKYKTNKIDFIVDNDKNTLLEFKYLSKNEIR
jgi:dihydrofolate reductase